MHINKKVAEIAGWYGTLAIVLAYILVSFKVIPASGIAYQMLNLTGAIGVILIAVSKNVKQSVVLNAFWALIATVAIITILVQH